MRDQNDIRKKILNAININSLSNMEKVIETKACALCSASFDITDRDMEFYDKVSPVFA